MLTRSRTSGLCTTAALVAFLLAPVAANHNENVPSFPYATPVFGLADIDGSLFVADAGAGIVELHNGKGKLVAALPGVTDVAPVTRNIMFATTGGNPEGPNPPSARKLYLVAFGQVHEFADLGAFEASVNPDGGAIDSNPFDVAVTPRGLVVADAAANALLSVDWFGHIDWIATLPNEVVPTSNLKSLAHCPSGPPDFCNLPAAIPAQPVTASLAIGPDGAYYVGELKGFPAPTGQSKVWRIEPGTRHAQCGTSAQCKVVASGFTSIIDLKFDSDGRTLYVVELDEASWFAIEGPFGGAVGGTVNACRVKTGACTKLASGLTMPIAVTEGKNGQIFGLVNALIPGAAAVVPLP
jgi:hypothetical protein